MLMLNKLLWCACVIALHVAFVLFLFAFKPT